MIADEEQVETIKRGLEELMEKTCLVFREYDELLDMDYVEVEGDDSGCWSYVGRHGGGQVINLQIPGCVRHGVVIHEFMHAAGFYHQQSSADRDEYVTINWDNIRDGESSHILICYGNLIYSPPPKRAQAKVSLFLLQYSYSYESIKMNESFFGQVKFWHPISHSTFQFC